MRTLKTLLACVALSGACVGATNATVLYNNVNAKVVGSDPVSTFGPLADSFTTGSTATEMDKVSIRLQELVSDPPSDYTTITLRSDDGTSPGAIIATIGEVSDKRLKFKPTVYSFKTDIDLSADTRYWIELSSTPDSVAEWDYSVDKGKGVKGEYFYNSDGVFPNSDGPYEMKISAESLISAVPEPSTWFLMIAGIGGIGLMMRRARKAVGPRSWAASAV